MYSLEDVDPGMLKSVISLEDRGKITQVLDSVKKLRHPNILICIHYMMKETKLVMITELITAGSIRE